MEPTDRANARADGEIGNVGETGPAFASGRRLRRPLASSEADGNIELQRSRGGIRPRFAINVTPPSDQRAQGKPDARCTRGLVCQ